MSLAQLAKQFSDEAAENARRRDRKHDQLLELPSELFTVGQIARLIKGPDVWSGPLGRHVYSDADEAFFDAMLGSSTSPEAVTRVREHW